MYREVGRYAYNLAWLSPGVTAAASSLQGPDERGSPGPPPCSPRDGPGYL